MEQAVCDVCKDIRIGKILIQTNRSTGEPEVCFLIKTYISMSIVTNLLLIMFSFTICVYLKILKTIW